MKQLFLSLLVGVGLLIDAPAHSQTMSNTDNVITLTNTCISGGVSNGAYTLVRKTFRYPGGADHVSVDLGGLPGGLYTLQIFDNRAWKSRQVMLTK
ncbi:MAG: hypothetical protein ABUL46_05775 [Chitinophaga rupis]